MALSEVRSRTHNGPGSSHGCPNGRGRSMADAPLSTTGGESFDPTETDHAHRPCHPSDALAQGSQWHLPGIFKNGDSLFGGDRLQRSQITTPPCKCEAITARVFSVIAAATQVTSNGPVTASTSTRTGCEPRVSTF